MMSIDLLAHDPGHGALHPGAVRLLIVELASLFRLNHPKQIRRARQTSDVGGEYPVCAALQDRPPSGRASSAMSVSLGSLRRQYRAPPYLR